jgi:hypothetical protein
VMNSRRFTASASRASDRKDSTPRHGRLLHPSTWAVRDNRGHAAKNKLANDGHDTRALQHYLGHKRTSSTRSDTPKWRPTASRTFGGTKVWAACAMRQRSRLNPKIPLPGATHEARRQTHVLRNILGNV